MKCQTSVQSIIMNLVKIVHVKQWLLVCLAYSYDVIYMQVSPEYHFELLHKSISYMSQLIQFFWLPCNTYWYLVLCWTSSDVTVLPGHCIIILPSKSLLHILNVAILRSSIHPYRSWYSWKGLFELTYLFKRNFLIFYTYFSQRISQRILLNLQFLQCSPESMMQQPLD